MKKRGMTLIELIISIAILALVLDCVIRFSNYGNKIYAYGTKQVSLQDESRNVFNSFRKDVIKADAIISDSTTLNKIKGDGSGIVYVRMGSGGYLYYSKNSKIHRIKVEEIFNSKDSAKTCYLIDYMTDKGIISIAGDELKKAINSFISYLMGVNNYFGLPSKITGDSCLYGVNIVLDSNLMKKDVYFAGPTVTDDDKSKIKNYESNKLYAVAYDNNTGITYVVYLRPGNSNENTITYSISAVPSDDKIIGNNVTLSIIANNDIVKLNIKDINGGEKYYEETFSASNNNK